MLAFPPADLVRNAHAFGAEVPPVDTRQAPALVLTPKQGSGARQGNPRKLSVGGVNDESFGKGRDPGRRDF